MGTIPPAPVGQSQSSTSTEVQRPSGSMSAVPAVAASAIVAPPADDVRRPSGATKAIPDAVVATEPVEDISSGIAEALSPDDSLPDLGGEWGDAFTEPAAPSAPVSQSTPPKVSVDAPEIAVAPQSEPASAAKSAPGPTPSAGQAATPARPSTSSSLSELVLDAELIGDDHDVLSPESFASAPDAAPAATNATDASDVLTGDDLSDDLLEDAEAISVDAEPDSELAEDVDILSAETIIPDAADVLDDMDAVSPEAIQASAVVAPPESLASNIEDALDFTEVPPAAAPAPEAKVEDTFDDVDFAANEPEAPHDDIDLFAEPPELPETKVNDVPVDMDLFAEPAELPTPRVDAIPEDVDVFSAEPEEPPAASSEVMATPDTPPEPKAEALSTNAQAPTPAEAEAIPEAESDWGGVLDAPAPSEPKAPAPVEELEFEDLPATPEPVAASSEAEQLAQFDPKLTPPASAEAPVIAAPPKDPEADALQFSLAAESTPAASAPPPAKDPEPAEPWQVAPAPKPDAPEEPKAEPPPEFDVAEVSKPSSPPAEVPPEPLPKPRLVAAPPAPPRDRTPISLDDVPSSSEPMQLASTWEFVGWQGGGEGEEQVGHDAGSTWADRVVDLDEPAASAPAEDGVALASAWEFMQQPWQPQAVADPAQALLVAASASTETPKEGPAVTAEQVLSALDTADSQGMVGKVLLAYSAGRFRRAFLVGDSFGLARVGRAWGPGCDRPEVSALKVDLDSPSLFTSALNGPSPSVFSAPQVPQDEAIFAALCGESESHLLVFPLHARGQPVAFFVAEHGPANLEVPLLEELGRVAERAVEICTRLHRFP
jgi:hypothetical protein